MENGTETIINANSSNIMEVSALHMFRRPNKISNTLTPKRKIQNNKVVSEHNTNHQMRRSTIIKNSTNINPH